MDRRPALGKGLSALIPDAPEPPRSGPIEVDIDLLAPNQKQPRLNMDDAKLEELAASIKAIGLVEPIVVRPVDGHMELIAGARRLAAMKLAGLDTVPADKQDTMMPEYRKQVQAEYDVAGGPLWRAAAKEVQTLLETRLGLAKK